MERRKRFIHGIPGAIAAIALIGYGAWKFHHQRIFAGLGLMALGIYLLPFFLSVFFRRDDDWQGPAFSILSRRVGPNEAITMVDEPFEKPRDY